jgi:hypothetical protein
MSVYHQITNDDRAEYGERAIETGDPDYGQNGLHTSVTDTLANIMHFCTLKKLSFDTALASARVHHNAETEGGEP